MKWLFPVGWRLRRSRAGRWVPDNYGLSGVGGSRQYWYNLGRCGVVDRRRLREPYAAYRWGSHPGQMEQDLGPWCGDSGMCNSCVVSHCHGGMLLSSICNSDVFCYQESDVAVLVSLLCWTLLLNGVLSILWLRIQLYCSYLSLSVIQFAICFCVALKA